MTAVARRPEVVIFREAAVVWKNFAGEKRQYNAEGDRNFNILMDEATGLSMERDGWNVKPRKRMIDDSEDYGPPEYSLKVAVSYKIRAPRVWLISSGGRAMLGEGLVGMLDDLEALKVDLTLTPYDWEMNGKTGRKAYLDTMFYTMYENPLELEYAQVPQISVAGGDQPAAIEAGSRQPFDYEGEVVH